MANSDLDYKKRWISKRVVFTVVCGVLAAIVAISFIKDHIVWIGGFPVYKKTKKEVAEKPAEAPPVPVKVYKVAKVAFRDTLPSLGTIKGFREYDLKFSVAGNVEYLNFKEGEKITQGDIIASLDQKEQLLKLEYAKIEYEKQKKLFDLGSIVETKLKQSQLEYQSAKAELDKTNLVAPSDGYIGSIEVDKGSYVTPQDKTATFVDIADVYVEFGVIEKDIAKIKEGKNVELALESFPDKVFKGQVDSVSPIVEGRSRTVKVRSKLANPDEKLKPGMFGRVNVLVYEKEDALVIPSSAHKKKNDQFVVYVVHPDEESSGQAGSALMQNESLKSKKAKRGKGVIEEGQGPSEPKQSFGTVEIRPVEIAYPTPDATEIKEGLEEGDLVIVDLEQELQDKAKVEVTETQEGIF